MKISPIAAFIVTFFVASLPLTPSVQAGTSVQRCESSDGSVAYTDQACAALGAISQPLPSALLGRIAREEAHASTTPGNDMGSAPAPENAATAARRSAGAGCAHTPTQLAMDLRGSFALGDVNRLAESYHWVGLSQQQSQPIMLKLERLGLQPLQDLKYFDARIGPGGLQVADAGPGQAAAGMMQVMFGGTARQVLDLDVVKYADCYFVRF